ncbi:hypothetical protein D0T23_15920 [Duganella sp. BJB475]|nr:hypothetical protein D0T23_15920 [Duganella sp. BJB475]RFP36587.1 hypothetical protein D0T21_09280 [Duganella sp. BJB476]
MTCTTHPSKETVRAYLAHRAQATPEPPPPPEEIRRQLGWYLVPAAGSRCSSASWQDKQFCAVG